MGDIHITTSIAQMPNVQGLAGAQLTHPEAQQVFAAQMAQQALKEQMQQVQKTEKDAGSTAIKADEERRHGQEHHPGRDDKKHRGSGQEDGKESAGASGSPWLGHLINRKI